MKLFRSLLKWAWWVISHALKLLPWIFQAVAFAAMLFFVAIASLWNGVPTTCRENAERWQIRALQAGLEGILDSIIYWAVYGATFITILICWLIFAFTTVWIVEIIKQLLGF